MQSTPACTTGTVLVQLFTCMICLLRDEQLVGRMATVEGVAALHQHGMYGETMWTVQATFDATYQLVARRDEETHSSPGSQAQSHIWEWQRV